MQPIEVQRDIRSAIAITYELQRHEHIQQREWIAGALGELEFELARIEAKLGGPKIHEVFPTSLMSGIQKLEELAEDAGPIVSAQILTLLKSVRSLERRLARVAPQRAIPSRPLLGVLPLRRVVPQDVHSVMDYAVGFCALSTVVTGKSLGAKIAGGLLGASVIGVSAFTDYRLSALKILPIETHEILDYVAGASALAAPFVLGYAKKDKVCTALHVAAGAGTLLSSLFTDYRAAIGVGRSSPP